MSGKEDEGDENLSEEDDKEDSGNPGSGEEPGEEQNESPGTDDDADDGSEFEPEPEQTDSGRIEDIEEELSEKEKEIADLRHKLKPQIREAEDEIVELREELESEIADHEKRLDELREELTELSEASDRPEQTEERRRGSYFPSPPSERPPKAAGVILGITGFLGLVASLGAGGLEITLGMMSQETSLGSNALIATAAVSAAVSIAVFAGGWWSYKRKKWYYTVFAALVCSVVLSPVGLPALVLVAVSERAFD